MTFTPSGIELKHPSDIFRFEHGMLDIEGLEATEITNVWKARDVLGGYCYWDGLFFSSGAVAIMHDGMLSLDEKMGMMDSLEKSGARFREIFDKKDFVFLFTILDKRVAIQLYLKYFDTIPDDQKWEAFLKAYTRSEFGFELLKDKYSEIFSYSKQSPVILERLQTFALMNEDELIIYHGENLESGVYDHYSWTMSKKVAQFFAYRYESLGEIWEMRVRASEIIDFIADRNEQECLIDYANIDQTRIKKYGKRRGKGRR